MDIILGLLALAIGGAVGIIVGKGISQVIRSIMYSSDKSRMKAGMRREAYLNQVYEDALCEEMDDLAVKAAKQMTRAGR